MLTSRQLYRSRCPQVLLGPSTLAFRRRSEKKNKKNSEDQASTPDKRSAKQYLVAPFACLCPSYVFVFATKKKQKIIYLGGFAPLDVFLAEAEVSDLDVAVLVQQQVLQL